jgi:DNA repair exonuclease SbcCD nuclease subunit
VLCETKLPTYAVVGQHDVYAYNPDTYKSSTLAFIVKHCGMFQVMWDKTMVGGVVLHPHHVWEPVEVALKRPLDKGEVNVLVSHHLLSDKKKAFDTVPTSAFAGSGYDVVLSGDLHCWFEPHMDKDTWFCNPGALARRSLDEIDRIPRVAIIEFEKGSYPVIEHATLASAKPGKEVFGQDFMERLKKDVGEFDPSAFTDSVDAMERQCVDVWELVERVGQEKGWPPATLAYISGKKSASA